MITDPMGVLEQRVNDAIAAVQPHVTTYYPPQIFADGNQIDLPLTVYTVEVTTEAVRARNETRVRCVVSVDTFGRSRKETGEAASKIRAAMLTVMSVCDMDRYFDAPQAGVVRRAQRFAGVMDLYTGVVYAE